MCGRYRLSRRKELLAEYFGVNFDDLDWEPRYNIAPTQPVLVVRRDNAGARPTASFMRWGLIPSWATDPKVGTGMINARAETAASKPSFRDALRGQRCLIPADGFYEWKRSGRERLPYCFEVNNGGLFAFAGIWDRWRGTDGVAVETCAILTATANSLMAEVHDRMPVIVHAENFEAWLDPKMTHAERAQLILRPFEAEAMSKYQVSARINDVANEGQECSAPADPAPTTASLFG